MYEIQLCGNCTLAQVNADLSGLQDGDPAPMGLWDDTTNIVSGVLLHDPDCPQEPDQDCSCGNVTFSHPRKGAA